MDNIRKVIREEFSKVFEQDMGGIKGIDILNHFPFSELPETKKEADWQNGISGWGKVYVPSLDTSDGQQQVVSKDDFTYTEFQGPKMMHRFDGYVDIFNKKFGDEPIFAINPDADWHSKVEILNPKFKEWRESGNLAKGDALKGW